MSEQQQVPLQEEFVAHFVRDPDSPIRSYGVRKRAESKLQQWTLEFRRHYTADPEYSVELWARKPAEYRTLRRAKFVLDYAANFTADPSFRLKERQGLAKKGLDEILSSATMANLNIILSQTRKEEIFFGFTPSAPHMARMEKIAQALRLPRESWLEHENWSLNKQMTKYHVPIRWKMQQVVAKLVECYHSNDSVAAEFGASSPAMREQLHDAKKVFSMCMMILSAHVVQEEGKTFPSLAHFFGEVDMNDLYDTHRDLEVAEERVTKLFETVSNDVSHAGVGALIEAMVKFDLQLNQHLGEEEEVVVPMSLVMPDAMHTKWPFSPETVEQTFREQYLQNFVKDPNSTLRRSHL